MLVYDVSDLESFNWLESWLNKEIDINHSDVSRDVLYEIDMNHFDMSRDIQWLIAILFALLLYPLHLVPEKCLCTVGG